MTAQRVTGLDYKDRRDGATRTLELAGVFVQIGLVPNTDWLKGVVKLSARGEIEVNARGETSVPGVFAAGDCTVVPYKQIVIAMGEGAKASLERVRLPDPRAAVGRSLSNGRRFCRLSGAARGVQWPRRISERTEYAGSPIEQETVRRRSDRERGPAQAEILAAARVSELGLPEGTGRIGRGADRCGDS